MPASSTPPVIAPAPTELPDAMSKTPVTTAAAPNKVVAIKIALADRGTPRR